MFMRIRIAFCLLFLCAITAVFGQQSGEVFGKNRIQHKQFEWKYYSSENFDIYFYDQGRKVARSSIDFLEEEFEKVTDLIGYLPYAKTKIFLYSSVADLQQSNIGLSDAKFDIGGETKFVKSHIEVANPGTMDELKQELVLKFTQLLVNDMLFGGSLKDMFQNTYLLNLPDWFVEGISQYVAKGWNEEMDDYTRELVSSRDVKKLRAFTGEDARIIGHSIWNFIAEKYGRSNISNVLNYTRIMRNEEKSITVTVGVGFRQLINQWQQYYSEHSEAMNANFVAPSNDWLITSAGKKPIKYTQIKISPNGKKVAYVTNEIGKYKVIVYNQSTGVKQKILEGGYKVINQQVNDKIPVIDWSDDNTLGIITYKKGKLHFWLYDLANDSKFSRVLTRLTNVRSLEFSKNGKLAVVSADVNGQNDIYLLSTRRDRTKRLTNDWYDDIAPSFVPGTNVVVFSSNRISDTVNIKKKVKYTEVSDNFNLFFYSLDTTKNVLKRITNTVARDYYPYAKNTQEIYYLSDQKGVTNLYKYNVNDKIYQQVTNYQYAIKDYDINFEGTKIAYVMNDGLKNGIFFDSTFNDQNNRFTPSNARKQLLQAKSIVLKRSKIEEIASAEVESVLDTTDVEITTELIDTDSFIFDEEMLQPATDQGSFLSQYRALQVKEKVKGPFPYENRLSWDNLVTSWVIDPIRGFGISLETEMNDMLENHRIKGGAMFTTDLNNADIFVNYDYLRERVDYSARYEREVIYKDLQPVLAERYVKNTFQVGATYPFNIRTKLSLKPFFTETRYDDLFPYAPGGGTSTFLGFDESVKNRFVGTDMELVYDNSVVKELNQKVGMRGKLQFTHHEGITDDRSSFSNISLDLRHNQKIHRQIILAGRVFYGRFFGENPQKYLLGGMDNWVANKRNETGNSPLNLINGSGQEVDTRGPINSQLLFSQFVTSLRGFDYGSLYGDNALLANIELRIPIVRYFHNGPISSNFFRNLQFTGFYDVGSSWSGGSPFANGTAIDPRTEKSPNGAFQYTVIDHKNPWLYSYGVGLRTVILGYYMKFDLAWPVENFIVQSPRLYVTLGFDF
jgi:Tol biopolymer transport system component